MKKLEKIYSADKFDTIREYINKAVEKYGEKEAFIIKNKEQKNVKYTKITYNQFKKDIEELGTGLIDMGLQGKRIAIIGNNSYEWAQTYISILCGVGIIVPLDKGLQEEEIKLSLKRSKVDAVIFEEKYSEVMKQIKEGANNTIKYFINMKKKTDDYSIEEIKEKGKKLLNNNDTRFKDYSINPDDMATIIFTSGTTSMSKAVMLSNRNIATNIYDMQCTENITSKDINMLFLPLHHTFGSTGLILFLANGATNVFCDGLRHIQENLKEYRVTTFVCVPLLLEAMYKNMLKEIDKQGKTNLIKFALKVSNLLMKFKIDIRRKLFKPIINQLGGDIRFIISGASAINKKVAKGFNDFGILTVQGYGLTETSPVLCAENEKHIKYGSVGLPMPHVEIKIANKNEDGIGEIIAKAPNVMLGYYEMQEETEKVIKDGWFNTGDIGYLDKDGYLFISGREKNVIVLKNGKNVYPEEIEQLIGKLPYVSEVMVFGKEKEDDLIVSAKVVYNKEYIKEKYENIEEKELKEIIWKDIKKINHSMPKYKYVKNLIITDEPMVKTTTAKIKRFEELKK